MGGGGNSEVLSGRRPANLALMIFRGGTLVAGRGTEGHHRGGHSGGLRFHFSSAFNVLPRPNLAMVPGGPEAWVRLHREGGAIILFVDPVTLIIYCHLSF